jgi:two-component system, OmpR family, phosphate regulon sensor histidine kinase PhoR
MKKKLILTSILSVFLSLLLLLGVSVLLVDVSGKQSAEKSLRNYLGIAEYYYVPNSSVYTPEKTRDLLAGENSDVRLTIVASDGSVLIDTFPEPTENHLNRPEIQSLGTIIYRKSATLNVQMIYLAGKDLAEDGSSYNYVRVALPIQKVEVTTYSLLGYGFLGIIAITILSGLLTAYLTKRSLRPLQKEVDELNAIVGEEPRPNADTKELGESIKKAKALLDERYLALALEKKKYETLLDEMEQGLIAIDSAGKIQLVNQAAATLFSGEKTTLLLKDYHVLSTDGNLMNALAKAMKANQASSFDLAKGSRIFLINVSPLGESFASSSGAGACLLSLDVTEKRKLEEAKRDFFANASHELKSPLTAIIGYQELLQNGTISDEKDISEAIETTLEESRRMKEIIQEMLVLSKLESGTPREKKPIALKDTVNEALKENASWIEKKKLSVESNLADVSLPMAKEDAQNLIGNLIENACKYNKDGGKLVIELTPRYFRVKDSGIGIAEKDQSRIYERFYRVDPAKSKALGGTGLGLSIVKHIALDYGFKITLESTLGLGSMFTILFS